MSLTTAAVQPATVGIPEEIRKVLASYPLNGSIKSIKQIKKGYINRTYRVEVEKDGRAEFFTLQRINTNVFPDVDALMENFSAVTGFLKNKLKLPGSRGESCVHILKTTESGKPYYRDESGCWRLCTHFTDVYSTDIPDDPKVFYEAGRAFGEFAHQMASFPVDRIHVVIPRFHDTYKRYLDLEKSIERDAAGRAAGVQKEIAFVRKRAGCFGLIASALESGEIPLRICHNDCNLNNILFDKKTGDPVAIIDLDTVMPGTLLYDYGDSMRIGTNTATDDEKDLTKVSCSLELYEQYARGYLESAGGLLTKRELELLPYASLVITSEDGIRFLADHIDGDTYYTIDYPGQNLDRSRTQLTLLADMERKLPQIKSILKEIYKELDLDADPFKEELWRFEQ